MCEVIRNILEFEKGKLKKQIIVVLVVMVALTNLVLYKNNTYYIWEAKYMHTNKLLAEYAIEKYPNAMYASSRLVRGYMNLLFKRGIYEEQTVDSAIKIAKEKQKTEVVYIKRKTNHEFTDVSIYPVTGDKPRHLCVVNDKVVEKTDIDKK